jgi:hypothetical protein
VSARAKVRHDAARVHAPLSVPIPETQVRVGPACAGAPERPQARRAAAMVGNDAILFYGMPSKQRGRVAWSSIHGRAAMHED